MYAVFTKSQHDDIYKSPFVKQPKLIWIDGKFIGEYVRLNSEEKADAKSNKSNS